MRTILCFGDSNTHGSMPGMTGRYGRDVRWPRRMEALLGQEYEVVEEGLPGRTTVFTDYIEPYRAGIEQIVPLVQSHVPDALVIMLGGNDTKARYHVSAPEIGFGMEELLLRLRAACPFGPVPRVVLAAPAPLQCAPGAEFNAESVDKSCSWPRSCRMWPAASVAASWTRASLPPWARTASTSPPATTPKWPGGPRRRSRRCLANERKKPVPARPEQAFLKGVSQMLNTKRLPTIYWRPIASGLPSPSRK